MAACSSFRLATLKVLLGLALVLCHRECGCLAQKEKIKNLDADDELDDKEDEDDHVKTSCQICPDGVPEKYANITMTGLTSFEIRKKEVTCTELVQDIRQKELGTRACNIFLISAAVHCGCPPPHPDHYQDTKCPICSNGRFIAPERLHDPVGGVDGFRWVGEVEGSQPTCADLVNSASLIKRTKKQCASFQDAADAYCGCFVPDEKDTNTSSETTTTTPPTTTTTTTTTTTATTPTTPTTTTTTTTTRDPPTFHEHNSGQNPPLRATRQGRGLKRNAAIGMGVAGAFAILALVALWAFVGGVCHRETEAAAAGKGDADEPDTDEEEVVLTEKTETATAEEDDGSIEVRPKGGPAAWL